jgi:hypothetical protein
MLRSLYPSTHCAGIRMGPKTRHCGQYKKSLAPDGNQIPAVQPETHHYTNWAILVPGVGIEKCAPIRNWTHVIQSVDSHCIYWNIPTYTVSVFSRKKDSHKNTLSRDFRMGTGKVKLSLYVIKHQPVRTWEYPHALLSWDFIEADVLHYRVVNFLCATCDNLMFYQLSVVCKIWGFHGGDYDDYHLLGDDAVWLL